MAEFTPSPLRMSSETRPFLYNLLDNVIGVDDEYETMGEKAKAAIRKAPYSFRNSASIQGILKSLYEGGSESIRDFTGDVKDEGIITALTNIPMDMSKGIVEGISQLKGGIEGFKDQGMSEGEARDAQLRAAIAASGALEVLPMVKAASIPVASVASSVALGRADQVAATIFDRAMDARQSAEAAEFGVLNGGEIPVSNRAGFVTPNRSREGTMDNDSQFGVLTDEASDNVLRAEADLSLGVSPEVIAEQYGLRFIDTRDAAGNLKERRFGYVSSPESIRITIPDPKDAVLGMHKLSSIVSLDDSVTKRFLSMHRPDALDKVTVEFKDLGDTNYGGYYDSSNNSIVVDGSLSKSQQKDVIRHEMEHMFLDQGGVGEDVFGSNPEVMFDYKVGALNSIEGMIEFHKKRISEGRGGDNDTAAIADLEAERDALKKKTSFEMYMDNPGEYQARIAQEMGGVYGAKRITPKQRLNPKINRDAKGQGLLERGVSVGLGALLPESRFVELARKYPAVRRMIDERGLDTYAFEKHGRVPMGPEDTRVYSFKVPVTKQQDALIQRRNDLTDAIPFADGGRVSRFTGLGSMGYML